MPDTKEQPSGAETPPENEVDSPAQSFSTAYVDSILLAVTLYTVTLEFGLRAGEGEPIPLMRVMMSPTHAKATVMLLRKAMQEYEERAGAPIPLSPAFPRRARLVARRLVAACALPAARAHSGRGAQLHLRPFGQASRAPPRPAGATRVAVRVRTGSSVSGCGGHLRDDKLAWTSMLCSRDRTNRSSAPHNDRDQRAVSYGERVVSGRIPA